MRSRRRLPGASAAPRRPPLGTPGRHRSFARGTARSPLPARSRRGGQQPWIVCGTGGTTIAPSSARRQQLLRRAGSPRRFRPRSPSRSGMKRRFAESADARAPTCPSGESASSTMRSPPSRTTDAHAEPPCEHQQQIGRFLRSQLLDELESASAPPIFFLARRRSQGERLLRSSVSQKRRRPCDSGAGTACPRGTESRCKLRSDGVSVVRAKIASRVSAPAAARTMRRTACTCCPHPRNAMRRP